MEYDTCQRYYKNRGKEHRSSHYDDSCKWHLQYQSNERIGELFECMARFGLIAMCLLLCCNLRTILIYYFFTENFYEIITLIG